MPLHRLPLGAGGVVEELVEPATAEERELLLRLMEIGFLPGEDVGVIARMGREPVAVRVGGQSTFALRAREGAMVLVRPHEERLR